MSEIYLSRDNALTHQLQFKGVGSNKVRNYNLSTTTEIRIEFYKNTTVIKSLSSLNNNGVTIVDAVNGVVSYQPEPDDFADVKDIRSVNFVRWVIFNPLNPNGLVFSKPNIPIRIFE